MTASHKNEMTYQHQPVLLTEILENLAVKPSGVYVDATFGRGGHAGAILKKLNASGRLLAMDKDPDAIHYANTHFAKDSRFIIHHGSFAQLKTFLVSQHVFGKVDGILFDLGVSSPQLDNAERGFSFLRSGKLDMRMDSSQGLDAATFVAEVDEETLANILREYGEERFSRRIARAIVAARKQVPIKTTTQLAEIIAAAHPAWERGKHPATRSFQAIRIVINRELDDLKEALTESIDALVVGGRLLVVSFHSLEDRLVKHFIQRQERGTIFPAKLPVKQSEFHSRIKKIGRPVKPQLQEIANNPRARSAILRIAEKLT